MSPPALSTASCPHPSTKEQTRTKPCTTPASLLQSRDPPGKAVAPSQRRWKGCVCTALVFTQALPCPGNRLYRDINTSTRQGTEEGVTESTGNEGCSHGATAARLCQPTSS